MRRKIGPYIDSRTPAQEDAILTGRLIPYQGKVNADGGCVMAWGERPAAFDAQCGDQFDEMCQRLGGDQSRRHAGYLYLDSKRYAATWQAAWRGAARAGEIIRARIMRNRLRRVLRGRPMQLETVTQ